MQVIISKLLKNFYEYDQKKRIEIVKDQKTKKVKEAKNKNLFYIFKGECEERARIVLFLIENDALKNRDDYYFAAAIIVNVGSLENFYLAYELINKYRQMGGRKKWGFFDDYFERQNWGITKKEIYENIENKIGVSPDELDIF